MSTSRKINKQVGLAIGPILLAVTVAAVLVYAMSISSQGTSTASINETNKLVASTVVQQAATLRTGIERMSANGTAVDTITYAVTRAGAFLETDIFAPNERGGGVSPPMTPSNALRDATNAMQNWRFSRDVTVPQIGNADPDIIAYLPDLKLGVCQSINNQLYGTPIVPATNPPAGGVAFADLTSAADADNLTTVGGALGADWNGRFQGCFRAAGATNTANDARFVYYRILAER